MLSKLRMLAVATFLLCVCQSTSIATEAPPSNLDGYWGGVIDRQGAELRIKVEFKTEPDGVKAVINIPENAKLGRNSPRPERRRNKSPGINIWTFTP
jgi:hypothetical protein